MARRARTRRGVTRTGYRPATDWAAATVFGTVTVDGVTGVGADWWDLSSAALADLDNDPETVRRIRGVWHAYPVLWPTAAPGIVESAIAIGVLPKEAVDGTVTPTPIQDSHWDGWMWRAWTYWRLPGQYNQTTTPSTLAAAVGSSAPEGSIWTIDSRAMRKLEDNVLFMVIDVATDTGQEVAVNYSVDLRWLLSESAKR